MTIDSIDNNKILKEKALKRLEELRENASATEAFDGNLSEEETEWLNKKNAQ